MSLELGHHRILATIMRNEGQQEFRSAPRASRWPRHLRVNPPAALKIGSQTFPGTAAEITDPAGRARVVETAQRKYWYEAPFIWLARVLTSSGVLPDRKTSFRVKVSD